MRWWENEIENIKNDNINGATYLTKKSIRLISAMIYKNEKEEFINKALLILQSVQPYMASLYNYTVFATKSSNLLSANNEFLKKMEEEDRKTINNFLKILPKKTKLLTISFSSLVYKALIQSGKNIEVFCLESRPKQEGVMFAKALSENGIKTTLLVDAAMGEALKRVEIAVTGSDGIGSFGLVHKIGTFPLFACAKQLKRKSIVLSPSYKIWPPAFVLPFQQEKNPAEITTDKTVAVKNLYFDITPFSLIDLIITDKTLFAGAGKQEFSVFFSP